MIAHAEQLRDSSALESECASTTSRAIDVAALRVLVVHDWIVAWGGAERTVEEIMTLFPRAELAVGVIGTTSRNINALTRTARETWLARLPFARSHHRWFLPLYAAAFASLKTRGYDLVISSASAFSKMVRPQRGVPHLCYCHTPPRYLWDLRNSYGTGGMSRALSVAGPMLRGLDGRSARGVDRFVANSQCVQQRIGRAYGRHADVVYPPVARKPGAVRSRVRNNTFLSLSRLVPYKRVDLAVRAANHLGVELIVAGDGPERAALEKLAGPTVSIVGEVSEVRAGELMETCLAMVFCAEEDFGIAPVEANAHGLPVIAYGRGGALESMHDGVSACFFDAPTQESLCNAMRLAATRQWNEPAIRRNAARFSPEHFRAGMLQQVQAMFA